MTNVRLLLVEDHEMVAESLVRLLRDEPDFDLPSPVATTVETAIALTRAHRPDIVIMDYALPDGDGLAAAAAIKAEFPDVAVLLLTGSAQGPEVLAAAIAADCAGFVGKSSAVADLAAAIRSVHAGNAVFPRGALEHAVARRSTADGPGSQLTNRELEVLALLAEGCTNPVIADRVGLSVNTVRNHVQSILSKLNAHTKLEAVASAVRQGLVQYEVDSSRRT